MDLSSKSHSIHFSKTKQGLSILIFLLQEVVVLLSLVIYSYLLY